MIDVLHRVGIKSDQITANQRLTTRDGIAGWRTNSIRGDTVRSEGCSNFASAMVTTTSAEST